MNKFIKNKKIIVLVIIALFILLINASISVYTKDNIVGIIRDKIAGEPKSVIEYFKLNESSIEKEHLYEDRQTVQIDDYTISLEEVYNDKENYRAYCRFSVTRENFNMRSMLVNEQPNNFQGFAPAMYAKTEDDTRFAFYVVPDMGTGTVGGDGGFQRKKDVMYVYYMFKVEAEECKPVKYIYLYDKNAGKDYYTEFDSSPNCAVAKFKLK